MNKKKERKGGNQDGGCNGRRSAGGPGLLSPREDRREGQRSGVGEGEWHGVKESGKKKKAPLG